MINEYEKNGKFSCNVGCPLSVSQDMDVNVPVEVCAYADVGDATFQCIDSTIVPNPTDACYRQNAINKFTLSQRIRIDIPIVYRAEANIDKEQVSYGKAEFCFNPHSENNFYKPNYNHNNYGNCCRNRKRIGNKQIIF